MCDLYAQLILVGIFSFGIDDSVINGAESLNTGLCILLQLAFAWRILRESLQVISTPMNMYMTDVSNWMDILLVGLGLHSAIVVSSGRELDYLEGVILTLTTGFVWIHLVMVISNLRYEVAIFVAAVGQIIYKLIPFFLTTLAIVFSFGNMFYIATLVEKEGCISRDDPDGILEGWTCSLPDSYFVSLLRLTIDFRTSHVYSQSYYFTDYLHDAFEHRLDSLRQAFPYIFYTNIHVVCSSDWYPIAQYLNR